MSWLTDLLIPEQMLRFAVSNAVVALPLGLLAWWAQARAGRPFLAHALWLIVLLKLVTPPLYGLPVPGAPDPLPLAFGDGWLPPGTVPLESGAVPAPVWYASWYSALADWQTLLVAIWLGGSVLVLIRSLIDALRFDRLLRQTSRPVAPEWQQRAAAIAAGFGLRRTPEVLQTDANISPMVWWLGVRVRIYAPRTMFARLDGDDLGSILTHELAHVRRGDHLVRWLECLVCITLWWNPIAWWARRNLRACEEICCDAFVLSQTGTPRDSYAGALVNALELLAAPMIRPSGLASHVNGGFIERRIRMILSRQTLANTPRWLRGLVLAGAVVVLPLGFTIAQDYGDIERVEQWLESGVNSAFVTREQADIMLSALRLAERQRIRLVTPDDYVINEEYSAGEPARVSAADPAFAVVRRTLDQAELEQSLAWATGWFREQAESGQISQSEADAIVSDIKAALATGLADGNAYYEQQFEQGLISQETAMRRRQIIAEMEEVWNRSPESAAIRRQKAQLEAGINFLRVPVEDVRLDARAQGAVN